MTAHHLLGHPHHSALHNRFISFFGSPWPNLIRIKQSAHRYRGMSSSGETPSSLSAKRPLTGGHPIHRADLAALQPCSLAALQPCSLAALQPCSLAALQPCSLAALQPCSSIEPAAFLSCQVLPIHKMTLNRNVDTKTPPRKVASSIARKNRVSGG